MKFMKLQEFVKPILEADERTRNSDDVLYFHVCTKLLGDGLLLENVLLNRKTLNIPSYESVGRARRKLQQDNPDLRACKAVEERRAELAEEYKAMAVGKAAKI